MRKDLESILTAEEIETGGGITINIGQFNSGLFFFTSNDWPSILVLDADPGADLDAACMPEWQEVHTVEEITDPAEVRRFWKRFREF